MAALQNNTLDSQVNLPVTEMATQSSTPSRSPSKFTKPPREPPLWQVYKQPAPLRIFPFPILTNSPISYVHLAITWLNQIFFPPASEPSTIHNAIWDHETRRISVADEQSMSDLWQQGFYGKGTLSRSEPNWLRRERIRQGSLQGRVSEVATDKRREERMRVKWERARIEQEAIEQKRREEDAKVLAEAEAIAEAEAAAEAAAEAKALAVAKAIAETKSVVEARLVVTVPSPVVPTIRAPVGPEEILALPNSFAELENLLQVQACAETPSGKPTVQARSAPVGPLELLALPNSQAELVAWSQAQSTASVESIDHTDASVDGSSGNDEAETNTTVSVDAPTLSRRKSVRFSPKVESTVFIRTDPPSPPRSLSSTSVKLNIESEIVASSEVEDSNTVETKTTVSNVETQPPTETVLVNKEHLQLAHEEAFFLTFALGALKVTDSATQKTLSTSDLLALLRQNSYFPTQPSSGLQPDDPFLIHYAVYHHFRSLGYVPRPGIKFGVDWLLYNRGPVFDHAEYGLLVLASYADPYWTANGREPPRKSWHWLMGVNRVLSKVFKSLVLVYVDIPPPTSFNENGDPKLGIPDLLKQYRIREVITRRWSSNRNR